MNLIKDIPKTRIPPLIRIVYAVPMAYDTCIRILEFFSEKIQCPYTNVVHVHVTPTPTPTLEYIVVMHMYMYMYMYMYTIHVCACTSALCTVLH